MNRELRRLKRAIEAMPEPEWQVFQRARYRDLDFFQIAAELDITLAEVEQRLANAMFHLMQFPE